MRASIRQALRSLVWVLAAWAVDTGAEPRGPATTRAQLQRWLVELRATGVANVDAPLDWQYSFSDADGRKLEALSLQLVRDGYRILALQPSAVAGTLQLRVARVELHTPATLERRNSDLQVLARTHGVSSYDGVDIGPGERAG